MSTILSFLLSFLLLYKYWTIFVAVFLSAIILPLPVSTLLLAAGAFSSQGYFSFTISLIVAVGANMLGDTFDFFLARKYGRHAMKMLHIKTPTYLERLERYVTSHAGPTIFVTRFIGTIEPLTSLLCGFTGVNFGKFIFYDFWGNAASLGLLLYAGFLLGNHWQDFNGLFSIADYMLLASAIIFGISIMTWKRSK